MPRSRVSGRVLIASHRLRACAAGLQATGSTVGSKEPNILANYLRALPGFDESARFYRDFAWIPAAFRAVSSPFAHCSSAAGVPRLGSHRRYVTALHANFLRKLHSSYPAWTRAQARAAHPRAAAVNARYAIRHIQSARPC
jgi:hypothetical protein